MHHENEDNLPFHLSLNGDEQFQCEARESVKIKIYVFVLHTFQYKIGTQFDSWLESCGIENVLNFKRSSPHFTEVMHSSYTLLRTYLVPNFTYVHEQNKYLCCF